MSTHVIARIVAGGLLSGSLGLAGLAMSTGVAQADSIVGLRAEATAITSALLPQGGPPNTPLPPPPAPEAAPAAMAPPPPPPPGSGIPDRRCGSDLFTGAPLPC